MVPVEIRRFPCSGGSGGHGGRMSGSLEREGTCWTSVQSLREFTFGYTLPASNSSTTEKYSVREK